MAEITRRETNCHLWTSSYRNGLKFFAYTYTLFTGLYTEDGFTLQGTEGEATNRPTIIPALATPSPKNCCGQLRI